MRRREWLAPGLVAGLVIAIPAALGAQAAAGMRDSVRVYRLQLRRGDTEFVRTVQVMRQQLEGRLDSLQHEFEGLGLDAPYRLELSRELRTIIASLADLTQLEQRARPRAPSVFGDPMPRARSLVDQSEIFAGRLQAAPLAVQPGWIGLNVEAPHTQIALRDDSAYIRYFGYPEVVSVEPNSPAERVGIARGDQLVAYDGIDLRDEEINLTRLLRPSRRLRVTVRRDGEEREFPVIVSRPPPQVVIRRRLSAPDAPQDSSMRPMVVFMGPSAPRLRAVGAPVLFDRLDPESAPVAGAKLVGIHDEAFGHIFGVSSGVLVTEVFSDPARASGLRGGDVVLRADGQDLTSVAQLRRIVASHNADRVVELEIVRQKRTRALTLRW